MTGRLRFLFAAAFLVLYLLVPGTDRDYLSYLQIRSWLVGDDSPFARIELLAEDAAVPPLEVALTTAPRATSLASAADYQRLAREWARRAGRHHDPAAAPWRLAVERDDRSTTARLFAAGDGSDTVAMTFVDPGRTSLLPAFLAIVLALLTSKVVLSLLVGCVVGAIIHVGDVLGGLSHFAVDTIWQQTLVESFRLHIMGFVVFLFASVGVMTRSGGIQGMVEWIRRFARGPLSTQLCSFVIGILIFFDDYSNCVISGSTMRPLTDKNRVSREKLAYIVDSTAAPVAGLSLISTWIAYEVSTFAPQLPEVTRPDGSYYSQSDGFTVFVQTLPFRFYCMFTLLFVLLTIVLRREFGPMLRAEQRAVNDGKPIADDARPMVAAGLDALEPPPGTPLRGRNALIPVLALVGCTVGFMIAFGIAALPEDGLSGARLADGGAWQLAVAILENASSERALCYSAAIALVIAAALGIGQRILTPRQTLTSAVRSASALVFAVIILILAWGIGSVCRDLGTSFYLTAAFQGLIAPAALPALMFLLACLIAFSTGTSYGTMAILLPNVVVLSHTMGTTQPDLGGTALMLITIGAVLEGSIFGDHCSPISDTTVLSSVATAGDHLHHVQTQAPYAIFTMAVALGCGYLPTAFLGPEFWPVSFALGIATLVLGLLVLGRNPAARAPAAG